MIVKSIEQAWQEVKKIFPTDYEKDEAASQRAGYDIYRHPTLNYYNRICDLGCRLEVLTGEYGDTTTNIWIDAEDDKQPKKTAAVPVNYGAELCDKIRNATTDFSKLEDFEKFVISRGVEFKTERALRAGYDRFWKCVHGILLTEDEFAAEAGTQISEFSQWSEKTAREVYGVLADLAKAGKIDNSDIYRYALYKWCLKNPNAIIAYQESQDKWIVNHCDSEISEDRAKVEINSEWGFEASRIKIIGIPYYDATDYQFIRFDCCQMAWLWSNENIYQVYE